MRKRHRMTALALALALCLGLGTTALGAPEAGQETGDAVYEYAEDIGSAAASEPAEPVYEAGEVQEVVIFDRTVDQTRGGDQGYAIPAEWEEPASDETSAAGEPAPEADPPAEDAGEYDAGSAEYDEDPDWTEIAAPEASEEYEEPAASEEEGSAGAAGEASGESVSGEIPAGEPGEAPEWPWTAPGNIDAEILGGGRYLNRDGVLYYFDGGLWAESAGGTAWLTGDDGGNLNLSGGWLYYTLGAEVRRLPAGGGTVEVVYTHGADIRQMYVMGQELRFLSEGAAFSCDMTSGRVWELPCPEGAVGLIPTVYGNLFLTGCVLDYELWAGETFLRAGVEQCWTDSDWLVLVVEGVTCQAVLEELFEGQCVLQAYTLHPGAEDDNDLPLLDQLANEAAFLESNTYSLMQDGITIWTDGAYTASNSAIASTAYTSSSLTEDQRNIVLRARQMAEVLWTPLQWRYAWGGDNSTYVNNNRGGTVIAEDGTVTSGYFKGGSTYKGIPYSQAVYTGYVGWDLSIDNYVRAVNDTSSLFYSGYSTYSRTAPYYGSDCSGFASFTWDLPHRCTCTSMLPYSTRITNSLQNLRIGDTLNNPNSHVVVVTNIGYDASGNVVSVEITEETPCKMRVTCYGELFPGKYYENTGSLSYISSYYFNGGYSIYRRNYSGSVSFHESDAVNLEESGYAAAPLISMTINEAGDAKVVWLVHSHSDAVIYYTTDGSTPSRSSARYTEPFEVTRDTTVKAIADLGEPYTGSYVLSYNVKVEKAEKPFVVLVEGAFEDNVVSAGSRITVMNSDNDAIYYTTDGSTPTRQSAQMTAEGITISEAVNFKAIAVSQSNLNSDVAEISVTIGTFHTITAEATNGGYMTPGGEISVLEGRDCTITINPLDFFEVKDVQVDGADVGAVASYTFRNVNSDHSIRASFSVDLPFNDVQNRWYTESVGFVYSKGLFSGTSGTTFSPNDYMTRGMFITVLGRFASNSQWRDLESWSGCLGITNGSKISVRTTTTTADVSVVKTLTGATGQHIRVLAVVPSGVDGARWYRVSVNDVEGYMRETLTGTNGKTLLYVYTGSFIDLPNGAYYTGYAQWANIYSIMNGVSGTTFGPNESITRQDICVLLYRYLVNYAGRALDTSISQTFTDDGKISDYAREAVYAMRNIGVVSGYSDGQFNPRRYATRAEVAVIFQRLYEYMNG